MAATKNTMTQLPSLLPLCDPPAPYFISTATPVT